MSFRVFVYGEEYHKFLYGTPGKKRVNNMAQVIMEPVNKSEHRRRVPITALQHELGHHLARRYFGDATGKSSGYALYDYPMELCEGWSDFWGCWDIDATEQYNLEGPNRIKAWRLLPLLEFGHRSHPRSFWNSAEGMFNRQLTLHGKKAPYYDQGWLLMRFLFSIDGEAYRRPVLHAYAVKEPIAVAFVLDNPDIYEEWFMELRRKGKKIDAKNPEAPKNPFRTEFVQQFERDWYLYLMREYRRLFGRATFEDLDAYYKAYRAWHQGPLGRPRPIAPWERRR